jgi:hypothetical protein
MMAIAGYSICPFSINTTTTIISKIDIGIITTIIVVVSHAQVMVNQS